MTTRREGSGNYMGESQIRKFCSGNCLELPEIGKFAEVGDI